MAYNKKLTRGEQMLALRRRREAASYPFFRGGFRPFFFGGPSWAVIALALWLLVLFGFVSLPTAMNPLAWHRHEMLFGFVGAVIAGFLLTAVPNWTGRLPIAGWPLAGLFGLWLAARLALLFSGWIGLSAAAVLDIGFFVILALLAACEVIGSNNRNLPVVALVLLFGVADATDYLSVAGTIAASDLGWKLAVSIVLMLISVIGGRIIPSFSRNWMVKRGLTIGLPTQPGQFDLLVVSATAIALFAWLAASASPAGALLILAAILQHARWLRWRGYRTVADPIVLVLHVGYAWLPVGLALLGFTLVASVPRSASVHALTAGAMTTMILAVMTRASLGHTARELKASAVTVLAYILVTIGALLRVFASLQLIDYDFGIGFSAVAWGGALVLFVFAYGPVLWKARLAK